MRSLCQALQPTTLYQVNGVALSLSNRLVAGFGCLTAFLLCALAFAAPAGAQDASTGAEANETVQIVKSSLMGIAIALLVLTIFYWIHTDPKRRARAHAKKADRKRAYGKSGDAFAAESAAGREDKLEDKRASEDHEGGDGEDEFLIDVVMLDDPHDDHDDSALDALIVPDVEREVS